MKTRSRWEIFRDRNTRCVYVFVVCMHSSEHLEWFGHPRSVQQQGARVTTYVVYTTYALYRTDLEAQTTFGELLEISNVEYAFKENILTKTKCTDAKCESE